MEYSPEVRQRFAAPARAGRITPGPGDEYSGTAEDRSLSVWIRFQIRVWDSKIECVRFQAFGCPHTIAAAERLAEALEGQSTDELANIDCSELARELGVPRDKFGKLLVLEDALIACREQALAVERD